MRIPLRSCLLLVLSATATVWAQADRALPDQTDFLQQLRSNLQSARLLQRRYAYREKRIDTRRDETGAEIGRTEKVIDVYRATPRTSVGKLMQKFSGRAWVAERDHQLMRLEVESTDDVSFGFGLLARLHKGSQMVFERRPVNDVWLPSELRYSGDARVLLLKKLRLEGIREYSDYRAFSIGTVAAVSSSVR